MKRDVGAWQIGRHRDSDGRVRPLEFDMVNEPVKKRWQRIHFLKISLGSAHLLKAAHPEVPRGRRDYFTRISDFCRAVEFPNESEVYTVFSHTTATAQFTLTNNEGPDFRALVFDHQYPYVR
jgi:hypothetical protein